MQHLKVWICFKGPHVLGVQNTNGTGRYLETCIKINYAKQKHPQDWEELVSSFPQLSLGKHPSTLYISQEEVKQFELLKLFVFDKRCQKQNFFPQNVKKTVFWYDTNHGRSFLLVQLGMI